MPRAPSLAAPTKAAKSAAADFEKIQGHAAVRADPLIKAKADWTRQVIDEFVELIEQRASPAEGER